MKCKKLFQDFWHISSKRKKIYNSCASSSQSSLVSSLVAQKYPLQMPLVSQGDSVQLLDYMHAVIARALRRIYMKHDQKCNYFMTSQSVGDMQGRLQVSGHIYFDQIHRCESKTQLQKCSLQLITFAKCCLDKRQRWSPEETSLGNHMSSWFLVQEGRFCFLKICFCRRDCSKTLGR